MLFNTFEAGYSLQIQLNKYAQQARREEWASPKEGQQSCESTISSAVIHV